MSRKFLRQTICEAKSSHPDLVDWDTIIATLDLMGDIEDMVHEGRHHATEQIVWDQGIHSAKRRARLIGTIRVCNRIIETIEASEVEQ